jgi:DNA-binding XRE family transcriptional regulator
MIDSASRNIERRDDPTPSTRTRQIGKIIHASFDPHPPTLPAGFREVNERIAQLEQREDRKAKLAEARQKVANAFYASQTSLAAMRLKKGLSQAALAQLVGTSQSHIARMEKGDDDIRLSTARRLAEALGTDLETVAKSLRKV